MHANPGFVSVVYLPHPNWIYLSLTGGQQGRASEKGSCEGPVSLDKSEVSRLVHPSTQGIPGQSSVRSPGSGSVAAVTYMDPEWIINYQHLHGV